ncbi:hypothetical protein [Leptospira sarikeiensis]|uniref:Uncharacterized protein n=1 Tax=Leptospira sarikeiensis TaxID=2484943 RepID=A0A4R9KFP8_9LEPT|nr:hypothetical protein [Leptospira sarikeiensis]TGL64103.1 hypothetical protein EHQ64_03685 [Leptospira sarikeiensis]
MFRKVGRALFILFIIAGILLISYPLFVIKEGEALAVWGSESKLISFVRGPGFVYEIGAAQFWEKSTEKESLNSLALQLEIQHDLSSGLFSEKSDEGKIKALLDVSFHLEGEESKKYFLSGGKTEAGRSKYLAGIFQSKLRASIEDDKNINLNKEAISSFLRTDLVRNLSQEIPWLKIESVRIIKLEIPDPILITNIFRNPNFILTKKLERIEALKKAELYSIQEEAKLAVSKKKWEQYKDFLKKNPDMKEFLLYDNIGENVEVLLLPSDTVFGDPKTLSKKKQSAPKPKEVE